jgi:hypothetical protein
MYIGKLLCLVYVLFIAVACVPSSLKIEYNADIHVFCRSRCWRMALSGIQRDTGCESGSLISRHHLQEVCSFYFLSLIILALKKEAQQVCFVFSVEGTADCLV